MLHDRMLELLIVKSQNLRVFKYFMVEVMVKGMFIKIIQVLVIFKRKLIELNREIKLN